jgi:hypothetical protein
MSKHGEDVTINLTGLSTSISTGKVGVDISTKLDGNQANFEQAVFNHTKEVHSEKEKSWFTWLNITITIFLSVLGALSLGDPLYGSILGLAISFIFTIGGKYARNKKIDVTISSR